MHALVPSVNLTDSPDLSNGGFRLPWRVALVTNCIAPYMLPVHRFLASRFAELRLFISTPMESDRQWKPCWDGLDVTVQRNISISHRRRFRQGFATTDIHHFPYDVLPLLRRYRPQLVISSQLGFRTLQAVAYRKLNPNSRLVLWIDLSEHTERTIGSTRTALRKFLLRSADAIVTTGRSAKRYLTALGVGPERITLAPYSTDLRLTEAATTPRLGASAHRLLYVGKLVESKGLHLLFLALGKWALQNAWRRCELWIAGDGPQRPELAAAALPPNVHVRFFGSVAYRQLPTLYAQCGISILPTLSDTWGLVINEALSAGLPVLGSVYSQAVQELVRDEFNGWTFRPDRPEAFSSALGRALTSELASLERMRQNAQASIAHLDAACTASGFVDAARHAMSAQSQWSIEAPAAILREARRE